MNKSLRQLLVRLSVVALLLVLGTLAIRPGGWLRPASSPPVGSQPALSQPALSQPVLSQPGRERPATGHAASEPSASEREELGRAIERSRRYLEAACDAEGRFVYEIDLSGRLPASARYNVLRHAGAMYALGMLQRREPRPETLEALRRSARFLRRNCLGEVPEQPAMRAIWSDPELTGGTSRMQAKLGGTGLGLAALVQLEQLSPGSVPREELEQLGRFLVFMQKPDGSFYSKYYPPQASPAGQAGLSRDAGTPQAGRDDSWTSLYYPGEAALGLLMLHQLDPQPVWRQAAADALCYLARPEAWRQPVLPDHWMLLAMRELLPLYDRCQQRETPGVLLAHARRTCLGMIREQSPNRGHPRLEGCFGDDGRTAPTATRVEGLLAALEYLPDDDPETREVVRESAESGLRFLLRCQVREPPHAGAMPMAAGPLPAGDRRAAQFNPRVRLVRIDYVQHAVCAMLQYEQLRGWRTR